MKNEEFAYFGRDVFGFGGLLVERTAREARSQHNFIASRATAGFGISVGTGFSGDSFVFATGCFVVASRREKPAVRGRTGRANSGDSRFEESPPGDFFILDEEHGVRLRRARAFGIGVSSGLSAEWNVFCVLHGQGGGRAESAVSISSGSGESQSSVAGFGSRFV